MKDIVFTLRNGVGNFPPKPAISILPDWYKNTDEYIHKKKEVVSPHIPSTIKKCMPVFDVMTAGYIIFTQVDVFVNQTDVGPNYWYPSNEAITWHPVIQAPLHPKNNTHPYPKFNNFYAIKTPKGYSTLFINPCHQPNSPFEIFEGLVDTDGYVAPINFPFVLKDAKWSGLIPAGTPIAQLIPIKRDDWKMSIGDYKETEESKEVETYILSKWFIAYKSKYWNRKTYK
jgi:hypothetical protein